MRWFGWRRKRVEERVERGLAFTGEKVGSSEFILKTKLSTAFSETTEVRRAYLAAARLESGPTVVLGLVVRDASDRASLLERVRATFAREFAATQSLDILFLDDPHEDRIAAVCKPFFVQEPRERGPEQSA